MNEIPQWMEKYIPSMMKQWKNDTELNISTIKDLMAYRDTLSNCCVCFPNKNAFDINMNIKIEFLEIINKEFKELL